MLTLLEDPSSRILKENFQKKNFVCLQNQKPKSTKKRTPQNWKHHDHVTASSSNASNDIQKSI